MKYKHTILLVLAIAAMFGCKSEYTRYVEREINRQVKADSLIFDMYLGETKKDFFAKCWDLNKQKIISQGTGNKTARYLEPLDSIADPVKRKDLLFYGIFDKDDVMIGMEQTYAYTTWAPWNKQTQSSALLEDLKDMIMKSYGGNDFIEVEFDDIKVKTYVKIDGRRQFTLYCKNDKDVVANIEDLHSKFPDLVKQ